MSELALSEGPAGFRLDRMELYNWGTFGTKVWAFPLGGKNALITGDIGTGKSTWVDALTTLLVPPQKITYNKAAGAERRERTDKSYLLGEYMSSREENTSYAKAMNLRGPGAYSVILAVFREDSASRLLSLAQLRWLRGTEVQRLYVISGKPLSVKSDFGDFSGDIGAFKKKLRARSEAEVFESFSDYSSSFRQSMGITEKALDLFNQTISMKTIGDLDDFIRNHMLEQSKARARIDDLLRNYDNLRIAHETVERTRRKRDLLKPLVGDGREHGSVKAQLESIGAMLQALPYYAFQLALPLLDAQIEALEGRLKIVGAELALGKARLADERNDRARCAMALESSEVGKRLSELDAELGRLGDERDRRRKIAAQYEGYAAAVGRECPTTLASFEANRDVAQASLGAIAADQASLQAERDSLVIRSRAASEGEAQISRELESLKRRTSSIPMRNLEVRGRLAEALGLGEAELPFVGELLQVRPEHKSWQGAAERVLHGFALSVLVPEGLYRKVSAYVRERDLEDRRLVFYRVPEKPPSRPQLPENSLARVIEVKSLSPFRIWLESELARHGGYARCTTMEEFNREPDAVTVEGLVKSGRVRHEKDDRRSVSDPRNYVLGWSNAEKIALLEHDLRGWATARAALDKEVAAADTRLAQLIGQRDSLKGLLGFLSFDDLDWGSLAKKYEELRKERVSLESSSDQLADLRRAMEAVERRIGELEVQLESRQKEAGALENELSTHQDERDSKARNLAAAPHVVQSGAFGDIDSFIAAEGSGLDPSPSLKALQDNWQGTVGSRISSRRNGLERKERDLRNGLTVRMSGFLADFPEHKAELQLNTDFVEDYAALLGIIEKESLPTYEGRFRALLRESTLQDITLFQNELQNDARAIEEAIREINGSLKEIEYSGGTYISLKAERREDRAIDEFRTALRDCIENTLDDDELYSEAKFRQVKTLLDRFASRESLDRSWTDHVTDVRSWFTFTASERWMEDGDEKEFYSSSSGKSGGQKEKLAYTILASALAYQYGLGKRGGFGGFRLVAIDEAFGRGSAESTRYGFRLFGKLDLQLVLVTPLQKISVIEEHVESIHLITNQDGTSSEVRSLTIEEYRAAKSVRQGAGQ